MLTARYWKILKCCKKKYYQECNISLWWICTLIWERCLLGMSKRSDQFSYFNIGISFWKLAEKTSCWISNLFWQRTKTSFFERLGGWKFLLKVNESSRTNKIIFFKVICRSYNWGNWLGYASASSYQWTFDSSINSYF